MKGSGIGGQAVMEGVMMKNGDRYAVAVRKPDKEIAVEVKDYKALGSKYGLNKIPIIRGVLAFVDSLKLGIGSLMYSASFYEDEETDGKEAKSEKSAEKKEKQEKLLMAGTVVLSVVLAVGIFMLLPYFISRVLKNVIESEALLALLEGVIRVALFIGYVAAISRMEDIKRVFMYHGAEHKSINCIENGLELTVKNVKKQSRHHKRCGTSFLLIVMLISILFFMFIRFDNAWLRIAARLVLIPVIAGISYEFIRLAGRSDNKLVGILSKPGLALQNLTTAEPDDQMIECAIASVEAVFDWKDFLAHYKDEPGKECCEEDIPKKKEDTSNKAKKQSENKNDRAEKVAGKTEKSEKNEKSEKPVKKSEKPEKPVKNSGNSAKSDKPEKTDKSDESEKSERSEKAVKNSASKKNPSKSDTPKTNASASSKKEVQTEKLESKINLNTPVPSDDDEDDEILKALDQYFILKQKKDE